MRGPWIATFAVLAALTKTEARAAPATDLSERKIAIAESGLPRSRGVLVQALQDSLSSSFGRVIRTRAPRAKSAEEKERALRKVAKRLGVDYVIALSEKKSEARRISVRLLDVGETVRTSWTVQAIAGEEQLVRAGQAIGARALDVLSDEAGAIDAARGDLALGGVEGDRATPSSTEIDATARADARSSLSSNARANVGASAGAGSSESDAFATVASGASDAFPGTLATSEDPNDAFAMARDELADLTHVEADPTAGPLYSAGGITLSTEAALKTETLLYFTHNPELIGANKINRRLSAQLTAGAKLKSDLLDLTAGILVRGDLADRARNRLEPGELTVAFNLDPVRLYAGHTTITWGRATLNSITDVVDPVDARDFLIREKLPIWVAGAGMRAGPVHLELLLLPMFRADIVDIPRGVAETGAIDSPSRWVNGAFPATTQNNVPVEYSFDPGLSRTTQKFDPQAGGRLSASLFDVDLAIGYLNQVDPFPSVRSTVRSSAEKIEVSSLVEYHRRHVFTLDGEVTAGRFHFVGETLLALPQTRALEDNAGTLPYLAATIGADFRAPRIIADHELRVFIEATATRALTGTIPNDPADPTVAITRGRFPFPLALMAHAGYSFGENMTLGVLAVTNLGQFIYRDSDLQKKLDLYLRPELTVFLFNRVQAVAGLDILLGGEDQFFGAFRQNARFSTRIQVDYDY